MNSSRGAMLPRLVALLVSLLLAGGVLVPIQASADTGPWSEPAMVSAGTDGWPWWPAATVDYRGALHVVWNGSQPGDSDLKISSLDYSRWDGRHWTKPNDIALSDSDFAIRSSLASDPTGRLYLVYKGFGTSVTGAPDYMRTQLSENLWLTTADGSKAESVTAWSAPRRITRYVGSGGYYSSIALDSRGTIHIIWTERDTAEPPSWGIYYSHSTDGGATWSKRVALDEENSVWWYRAQLKIDGQDRLHVVWEVLDPLLGDKWTSGGAVYALSRDGGQSWSRVGFPDGLLAHRSETGTPSRTLEVGPQQPAVGIDGRGNILLVFREPETNRILYRQSTDGINWSPSSPLPGVKVGVSRPFDSYDCASDSAGHVHLVGVGYPEASGPMGVFHWEWDGQNWSGPSVVASSPPFPEYPRLAVGEGNRLYVVWFDGNRETVDRTPLGIWFSTAQTSAPRRVSEPVAAPIKPDALATPVTGEGSKKSSSSVPVESKEVKTIPATDNRNDLPEWLSELRKRQDYPLVAGVTSVMLLLIASRATRTRFSAAFPGLRRRSSRRL